MRGLAVKAAVGAIALAALGFGTGTARAADPVISVGADGTTAPNFSYKDAIRERVFIPVAGIDSDGNGITDRVAVDIVRPKESGPSLKVPAIIDDSPYYTSVGRGNETQYIHTTAAGVLDKFPLFVDNFFVPRGYAYIAAQAIGTAFSTGCPLHGGSGDVAGFKAVIDWLEGRVPGYTTVAGTDPVVATWASGKNAMIGKSYDGTFANGVASTGVDGLTTIVPISAISSWYDYSRMGGIRENTHYPASLDNSITSDQSAATLGVVPPVNHRTACASIISGLNSVDGDTDGDINPFWQDRDYRMNVNNVKAAVFETHGINDDNVRPDQFAEWWAGLAANNVPRKLWRSLEGHVDPFDYRRGAWVDTLHRWFDYWLQGVPNGIMNQPRVDMETAPDTWTTYADWPIPGTVSTDVFLSGRSAGTSGFLGAASGGSTDTLTYSDPATGNVPSETTDINTPNGSQASRLVFLSPKLKSDVTLSGTPIVDIQASLSQTQTNLAALVVDYGAGNHVGRGGSDGVSNTTTRTCWGPSSDGTDCTLGSTCTANTAVDNACYLEVSKPVQAVTSWRVSKGILDSSNRTSLISGMAEPAVIGTKYDFKFRILPTDYVFPAGHQIGVILLANYSMGVTATRGTAITVDTKASKISLPVTGGAAALTAAGALGADTTAPAFGAAPDVTQYTTDLTGSTVTYTAPVATDTQDAAPAVSCTPASGTKFAVGSTKVTCTATDANGNASQTSFNVIVRYSTSADGTVGGSTPATLSLVLGAAPSFGTFTPGVAKDYTAATTATVISTAGDAALSVADATGNTPGHLVNTTFSLPTALQASGGGAFADVGATPTTLKTWTAPTSNEAVAVQLKQHINANDALRTGAYSKTLTFTLSTTTP
jgi:X-Pro dipeptidyl-peptidase